MPDCFEVLVDPSQATIRLRGECDVQHVDVLRQAIAELSEAQASPLVVDCEELSYMGSCGVTELLTIRTDHPDMRLVNVPTNLQRVLEMTGLDRVFEQRTDAQA